MGKFVLGDKVLAKKDAHLGVGVGIVIEKQDKSSWDYWVFFPATRFHHLGYMEDELAYADEFANWVNQCRKNSK